MNALMLAGYAPSLLNFRRHLILDIQDRGYTVTAVAPEQDAKVSHQLSQMGVLYRAVPMSRSKISALADLRVLARYVRLMRATKPELVLAYTVKPVVFGLLAARFAGISRRFALITGLGYAYGTATLKQRVIGFVVSVLYRLALSGATAVFFQNPDDRDMFLKRRLIRADRAHVVNGSGVDVDYFSPAPHPTGPVTFLLMARLLADKGIREYAQAAQLVRREWPEARFLLAGATDPNPAGIPMAEVLAWHQAGVVQYLGVLDDVRPAIRQSSVYVLPSYREGTPRSSLEAMASGRAIITTDAPGCRETVQDGVNGWLVPTRDAMRLAEAMQTFARDPTLASRMGHASRRLAEDKYDVRRVNAQMLTVMGLKI